MSRTEGLMEDAAGRIIVEAISATGVLPKKVKGVVCNVLPPDNPGYADIAYEDMDGFPLKVAVSTTVLKCAGACFEGAEVEIDFYEIGTAIIMVICYVGPPIKELVGESVERIIDEMSPI